MSKGKNLIAGLLSLGIALAASAAGAVGVADAQAIIDRSESVRCELTALEQRARDVDPASAAYQPLARQIQDKQGELQRQFQASWPEYAAVMGKLSAEERARVERYSAAMAERCNRKACGAPSCAAPDDRAKAGEAPPPESPRPARKALYAPSRQQIQPDAPK